MCGKREFPLILSRYGNVLELKSSRGTAITPGRHARCDRKGRSSWICCTRINLALAWDGFRALANWIRVAIRVNSLDVLASGNEAGGFGEGIRIPH